MASRCEHEGYGDNFVGWKCTKCGRPVRWNDNKGKWYAA